MLIRVLLDALLGLGRESQMRYLRAWARISIENCDNSDSGDDTGSMSKRPTPRPSPSIIMQVQER